MSRLVDTVETPAAVVDLDRLERNLGRWQAYCDRVGLANRPHVKTHKCVEIARRQAELGASGITCQTLGEAETMVDAGLDDVLVPYNIVGAPKLERLTALLERATLTVSVDDAGLLDGLESAAAAAGRTLAVVVDCDTGLGRTGVQSPEAAVELAVEIARRDSLRLDGVLTYPSPEGAEAFFAEAVALAGRRGLSVSVVSAGGSPSMWASEGLRPTVTEYRAGTYAFYDRNTVAAGAATLEDVALTVAATVVSRPTRDRAIVDAGSKALSSDSTAEGGFGLILEAPHSRLDKLNEEHGYVSLDAEDSLELGQVVRIVPNHACVVSNLHEAFVVVQADTVVDRWPVDARGRSQRSLQGRS
jgi:D-serine deaminase-like pyridoxal phosphate-dependent protein